VELALCSLCHVESSKNSFPQFGINVESLGDREESGDSSKTGGETNDENGKDNDNVDVGNYLNDNRLDNENRSPIDVFVVNDDDEYAHENFKLHMNRMRSKATQISVMQKILEIIFLRRKLQLMGTHWLSVSEI